MLRSARDPITYDPRRNPAVWIGFVLALPIPLVACLLAAPAGLAAAAFGAPLASAVVVGAVGRLAGLREIELGALHLQATGAGTLHRAEIARLSSDAATERSRTHGLEIAHRIVQAEVLEAQALHRGLVPRDIVTPDVRVSVRTVPSTFLGGDYLRASLIRPGCLYLCVGDVSGHGIAAALIVSRIHGLIRGLIHADLPPERLVDEVNRQLSRLLRDTYHFMTLAVFRVDLETRTIQYATAGHPAQLLLRAAGGSEELSTPNRVLGMADSVLDATRPSGAVAFSPGDTLVLFTDGLFEIHADEGGLMLGHEALRTRLAALAHLPPDDIIEDIFHQATLYQGSVGFSDDVSMLVARFTGGAPVHSGGEPPLTAARPREVAALRAERQGERAGVPR